MIDAELQPDPGRSKALLGFVSLGQYPIGETIVRAHPRSTSIIQFIVPRRYSQLSVSRLSGPGV